jgi:hypothetical protein
MNNRSRVRFVLSSWKMPTAVFDARTMPNRASWGGPTTATTTSRDPRMALNLVRRFARRICRTVRPGGGDAVLA